MNVLVRSIVCGLLMMSGVAGAQRVLTQQDVEAKLQGPFLMLRGMWDCNSLHFDAQGNLLGSCAEGPFSMGAMIVKSVKLSSGKLEIKGSRASLQFAPGAERDSPAIVSAVSVDHMTITIARDPQNAEALDTALDRIFAKGFDDELAREVPAYWRGWVRHQAHPEIPIDEAEPGVAKIVDPSGLSSGVTPPRLVRAPNPSFSDEARRKKVSGIVVLGLIVDRMGRPHDVSIVRPLGMGLDEKAVEAVSQYEFAPATRNGEPVPVVIHIEVNFRIY